jgi:hypothetical protein
MRGVAGAGAILAAANAAADVIEQRVGNPQREFTEPERAALLAAQAFMFNAAADCWPGWQVAENDAGDISETLNAGLTLAHRSSALVHRLALGAVREGTSHWMIGAYELALKRRDDAVASFSTALLRHTEAKAPGLVLLAQGYIAIAYEAAGRPLPVGTPGCDEILSALANSALEDASEFSNQLQTARRIFASGDEPA